LNGTVVIARQRIDDRDWVRCNCRPDLLKVVFRNVDRVRVEDPGDAFRTGIGGEGALVVVEGLLCRKEISVGVDRVYPTVIRVAGPFITVCLAGAGLCIESGIQLSILPEDLKEFGYFEELFLLRYLRGSGRRE
jgi:hypothetical protein